MNTGLLWIDILVIVLLWVMAVAAFAGRIRRRLFRWPACWIGVGIPLLMLGGLLAAALGVRFNFKIELDWYDYINAVLIGYVVSTAVILWIASRRGPDSRPAAAHWRRGPLVLGLLAAVAIGYMTLNNLDLALRARCAILGIQLNTLYIAMSPAIVSDSQNAATLYEQAFRRLKADKLEADVNNPPTGNNEDFDPNEPATLAFLSHESATIQLLRDAAAMPGCRFEQDVKDLNVTMDLTGMNESRNAANVLRLHAKEEISHGRASSAIADVAALYGMSRQIGRRPLLISALVGAGIDAIANKTLEETLPIVTRREELDSMHLDALPPFGRAFQQALWGEERFGLMCYSMPDNAEASEKLASQNANVQSLSSPGIEGSLFRVLFLNLDAYLRLMKNMQNSAIQPYYQVHDHFFDADGFNPVSDMMTAIIAPSVKRAFETTARIAAGDACARTAVAMTEFKLDHGTFPPQLSALIPAYLDEIPVDPFDGHPLRLVVKKDQWIIYSVGPDAIDHGGVQNEHTGKGDIIFPLKSGASTQP